MTIAIGNSHTHTQGRSQGLNLGHGVQPNNFAIFIFVPLVYTSVSE